MKTIFRMALLVTILIAISCSKEPLEEPIVENATEFRAHVHTKKCKWVTRPLFNRLESAPDPNTPGVTNFWGRYFPFGRVTGTVVTTSFTPNPDRTVDLKSSDVNIFSDGDKIFSITTAQVIPIDAANGLFTGGAEITGGTGRFEGATGHLTFYKGVIDLVTFEESHRSYGTIRYRKCWGRRGH